MNTRNRKRNTSTRKRPKVFRAQPQPSEHNHKFKSLVDFPDEILLKIFDHLDFKVIGRCVQVCKRFRGVSLRAEYARLSIIEAALAIKRRQLELELEDLKKHEAEEHRRKERIQKN